MSYVWAIYYFRAIPFSLSWAIFSSNLLASNRRHYLSTPQLLPSKTNLQQAAEQLLRKSIFSLDFPHFSQHFLIRFSFTFDSNCHCKIVHRFSQFSVGYFTHILDRHYIWPFWLLNLASSKKNNTSGERQTTIHGVQ